MTKFRVVITDTNGKETVGLSSSATDAELAKLREVLCKLRELNHLSLETHKGTVYFNTKHVVSALIEEIVDY